MEVYRFRSIEALLCEYQELENKTIMVPNIRASS